MSALLEVRGMTKAFGGVTALSDVRITLEEGEIVGIIGPNGAGKSTLLNCISGADRPTSGTVHFAGADITRARTDVRARMGIRRTFQLERLTPTLSLVENVMTGLAHERSYRTVEAVLGLPRFRAAEADTRRRALAVLGRFGLGGVADADPATVPPGRRRLVEIARAYVSDPRVLLLDEPTGGLSTAEAEEVFDLVKEFRSEGRAVAIIEHRIRTAADFSDRLVVLDRGRMVAEGDVATVQASGSVISAYLGTTAPDEPVEAS